MNTYVKLVPNAEVKGFIKQARSNGRNIEVLAADEFFVRDEKTNTVIFKGMRLREDLWGLTFTKTHYQESK